ncbi:MAG: PAS domain S-box protein, partial [Flavisolibacter sp.]
MRKLQSGINAAVKLPFTLVSLPGPETVNTLHVNESPDNEIFIENEKYKALFELIPDVIVQTDPSGVITAINPASMDFFGFAPEEMKGRSLLEFYNEPLIMEKMMRLVEKAGHVRNYQVKMKTRNGDVKTGSMNVRYIYNRSGTIVGIDGFIRDITDKIKAQEEAARAKDFYETILHALAADIAVFDMDGRYRFLNLNAIKDAELRKWMIGKTDFEYCEHKNIDISIAEGRFKNYDQVRKTKQPAEWVEELTTKEGKKNYVLRILKHFEDKNGKEFIVGYGIGVTQLKNAEEQVLKREKQLNEAQQIARIGSYEWNVKTGEVTCSDEIFNILESTRDAYSGKLEQFLTHLHPGDISRAEKAKKNLGEIDPSSYNEFRIVTATGKEKYIAARYTTIKDTSGETKIVLGTIQDITEQKEFEKRLFYAVIESEENERNRIAGELHDGVCQDLTVAKLSIEFAESMITQDNEKLKQLISSCRKTIVHTLNMTRKVSHQLMPKELFDRHFCDITSEMIKQLNQVDS